MNLYEQKSQELNNIINEDTLEQNLTEEDSNMLEMLENLLESNTLYLEDSESERALVLQYGVNTKVLG